ncbi:MAG: S9 family peptidase [Candidatus Eiseniibacteriota bacterium]
MSHEPLPIERLYMAHDIDEPAYGASGDEIFYARRADGKRTIVRHSLTTGLAESVTAVPRPAGGVGYGNGHFALRNQTLVYAASDGRLHAVDLAGGSQRAITPAYEGVAAPVISPCGRWVAFLCEQDGRCNVLLTALGGGVFPIKLSADPWYAFNPAFSPDGGRIAWQEWNQSDMPWDESRIVISRFPKPCASWSAVTDALPVSPVATIAKPRVATSTPQWSPDGKHLAFVSDESGWRSLWIGGAEGEGAARVETGEGEIGHPDWVPFLHSYRWNGDGSALYAIRRRKSCDTLLRIAWPGGQVEELASNYSEMHGLQIRGEALVYMAANPSTPSVLVTRDGVKGAEVVRASTGVGLIAASSLSTPEVLSWRSKGGAIAWGILYPAVGPAAGAGPLPVLVHVHGGPTSQVPFTWFPHAQYFATRGWHYLIVNHRGGTGFGRAYQDQLRGKWGVVDLEDSRTGAEWVIQNRGGDPKRVAITGGSAGGYATLWALTQQPEFWTAGVALFALANIYDAVIGSHRFERHYEEGLFGKLPEAGPLWRERSPLTHVDKVKAPVLLFHGREDKAVPHQQSVDFTEAVKRRGGTAELLSYEGEGHGFTKEVNRRDVIERMEAFLEKYVVNQQR